MKLTRELGNGVWIFAGILSAGMGLHGFLLSSNFIDGGVTGVSMLLSKTLSIPLSVLIPLVNIPFLLLGYRLIGLAFTLRSCAGIAGLAIVLATVHFPDVTPDPLLTAVFGGLCIGAGIGLAMRGGGVLDGTEIAALLISKRSPIFRVGDVILAFNVLLFLAAISTLGTESALYSILTYAAATRTLDFVLHGVDEYNSMTIISEHSGEIRTDIMHELGRGVTVYHAHGGLSGATQQVLVSVLTRLELGAAKRIIDRHDKSAFVVISPVANVRGGVTKRVHPIHE